MLKTKIMKKHNFLDSFIYALHGFRDTFKSEYNFKVHLAAAIIALLLGFLLNISIGEWFCICLVICLVFAAELFNTAIESLADEVSSEVNPQIKKVKDAAAAAVLILSVFALICGVYIYVPKILAIEF